LKLSCCGEWYELSKEYKAKNFYGQYLTFIYSGGKCSKCSVSVLGYANYIEAESGLRRDPCDGVHVVGGKTRYRYDQAIASGEAVLQDKLEPDNTKDARAGLVCGVSEYTLRAKNPDSYAYVLRMAKG
jgi:hypothetical protein